jgi:hypothetical protein
MLAMPRLNTKVLHDRSRLTATRRLCNRSTRLLSICWEHYIASDFESLFQSYEPTTVFRPRLSPYYLLFNVYTYIVLFVSETDTPPKIKTSCTSSPHDRHAQRPFVA